MEFEHKGADYRVVRGVGTNNWMLVGKRSATSDGWRLLDSFNGQIDEYDIEDHARNSINQNDYLSNL